MRTLPLLLLAPAALALPAHPAAADPACVHAAATTPATGPITLVTSCVPTPVRASCVVEDVAYDGVRAVVTACLPRP